MTKDDIISKLISMGYNNDASATQQDLYTTIKRGQLFSNSNRLNAGWARGKYIVASIDDTSFEEQEYVYQWMSKVSRYQNQYLCLEIQKDTWAFFDYSGSQIPFVVKPPQLASSINDAHIEKVKPNSVESIGYRPYLTAIRTKPFLLLAGISGTGKSRIVRELAFKSCPKYLQDNDGTTPGNYCMIEVKPNWHDSTELLGYYSNLSKGYQFKKFVMFLVKAKMFPKVPFFICLDEMNLAPVEHYFAEILSIIETRKHPRIAGTDGYNKEVIKTDPIIEARYFRELAQLSNTKNVQTGQAYAFSLTDREIYMKLFGIETESGIDPEVGQRTDLTTEGLTLPDNVIIIGTVNMDDTTHQFSRKVIDRAMTIEMNGGKLSEMYGGSKNLEYLSEDEQQMWQGAFRQRYVTADEVLEIHKNEAEGIMEKVPARLEEINKALKGTPFEVSYRVLNELTIMIGVMLDEQAGEDINSIIDKAIDRILLMKILPRIEGDLDMFNLSQDYQRKHEVKYSNRLEWLKELAPAIMDESDERYPQTARGKIQEMIDRLENQEFTRFWP